MNPHKSAISARPVLPVFPLDFNPQTSNFHIKSVNLAIFLRREQMPNFQKGPKTVSTEESRNSKITMLAIALAKGVSE
jgi:hypothetical protein